MPFLYPIHADPDDYQRWTDVKIKKVLKDYGFTSIKVTAMGGGLAVIFDLIRYHDAYPAKKDLMIDGKVVLCRLADAGFSDNKKALLGLLAKADALAFFKGTFPYFADYLSKKSTVESKPKAEKDAYIAGRFKLCVNKIMCSQPIGKLDQAKILDEMSRMVQSHYDCWPDDRLANRELTETCWDRCFVALDAELSSS